MMDRGLLKPPTGFMRALLSVIVLGLAGCVTPSIPIPPPDPVRMEFQVTTDSTGTITAATFSYPPVENYKGGVAYVYNRSVGTGTIHAVNADGSIGPTSPVAATLNHQIVITIENDEQTVSTCVLLKEGSPTSYCP